MITTKLRRGTGRFEVAFQDAVTLGASNVNRTVTGISIGTPSYNRKLFVLWLIRTNTTTGVRRVTTMSMLVNGVTYNGTQVIGPSAAEGSPIALWEFDIPAGTVGDVTRTLSGSGTGSAAESALFYSCKGGAAVDSARNLAETISIDALSGDSILRFSGALGVGSGLYELLHTLTEQGSAHGTVCSAQGGVLANVASSGTYNFEHSAGSRSLVCVLRRG